MAINYLNTVNLNKNQLEQAAIQNLTADPATGVLGQVYYNTVVSELKICTTANVVGPPAVNAIWTIVGSYDYWVLDADGNGATANITNGMTADFVGGLKITTDSTVGGTLNIVHDLQTQTDTANTAAPEYGGTFTTVDSVTRDTTGHVTGINVKTVTIPASDNTNTQFSVLDLNNLQTFNFIKYNFTRQKNSDVYYDLGNGSFLKFTALKVMWKAFDDSGLNTKQ